MTFLSMKDETGISNSEISHNYYHKGEKFPFWSQEEDEIVLQFGNSTKRNKWVEAAKLLNNKTPRHCYFRFKTINPNCKKGFWTKKEDETLINYIKIFGNNWSTISRLMKTRSNKQIHNRYKILFCSGKINHNSKSSILTKEKLNLEDKLGNYNTSQNNSLIFTSNNENFKYMENDNNIHNKFKNFDNFENIDMKENNFKNYINSLNLNYFESNLNYFNIENKNFFSEKNVNHFNSNDNTNRANFTINNSFTYNISNNNNNIFFNFENYPAKTMSANFDFNNFLKSDFRNNALFTLNDHGKFPQSNNSQFPFNNKLNFNLNHFIDNNFHEKIYFSRKDSNMTLEDIDN